MATPSKHRYPLSTVSGQHIPLDILRPSAIIKKDFLSSSASSATALPIDTEVIMLRATQDCFIKFHNSSATKPISGNPSTPVVDTLYLQRGEVQAVAPLYPYYSVIGDTVDGILYIQVLETWAGLSLDASQRRK